MTIVGVLGGMGPAATIDFFTRVVAATAAVSDDQHLHLLIDNNPAVPDRNRAIAGTGPSPAPELARMARRLEKAGADFLVMPCNSAHAFADSIHSATSLPFINMVDETVAAIGDEVTGPIGLLAADGCLMAGLYQRALAERGRIGVVLDAVGQKQFMNLLYRIKAGEVGSATQSEMLRLADALAAMGATLLIAACTEVPLVLNSNALACPVLISTDILVRRTIERAAWPASGKAGVGSQ